MAWIKMYNLYRNRKLVGGFLVDFKKSFGYKNMAVLNHCMHSNVL